MDAGVPLPKALDFVAEKSSGESRRVVLFLQNKVQAGGKLSEAARERPDVFSRVQLHLIEAGEVSGLLNEMLLTMAEVEEKHCKIRKRLVSKLIYPVILLHLAVCIPSAATLVTEGLFAAVGEILMLLIPIYLLVGGLFLVFRSRSSLPEVQGLIERVGLKIPVLKKWVRYSAAFYFCRVLRSMLIAGIAVKDALDKAGEATGISLFEYGIKAYSNGVNKGESLTEAVRKSGFMEKDYLDMLATGEISGKLDTVLLKMSEEAAFEAERAGDFIGKGLPYIAAGAVVLFIVFRILTVIFKAIAPAYESLSHLLNQ